MIQSCADVGQEFVGRVAVSEVLLVGNLDTALDGQRAPVARRPPEAEAARAGLVVGRTSDAEGLADHDAGERGRQLAQRRERGRPEANRSALLGFLADEEPGTVFEMHDGQMERRSRVQQPDQLAAAIGGPAAAVHVGILGEHRHRPAVEARQPSNDRTSPALPDLEEAALIEHRLDDRPHLVDPPWLAGHDRDQFLVTALRAVAAAHALRQLVDVRGQIRQELPCALKRLRLAADHVVDGPVRGVNVGVAELFFAVVAQ